MNSGIAQVRALERRSTDAVGYTRNAERKRWTESSISFLRTCLTGKRDFGEEGVFDHGGLECLQHGDWRGFV
jgi:hypothetical protein